MKNIKSEKEKINYELIKFLYSIYNHTIIINDWNIIKPYSINIFLPYKKLAICYNLENYKFKLCLNNHINLIYITYQEWIKSKYKIKKYLKKILDPIKYINTNKFTFLDISKHKTLKIIAIKYQKFIVAELVFKFKTNKIIVLKNFYVKKEFELKNSFKLLLYYIIKKYKVSHIFVYITLKNTSLISFYKYHNFKCVRYLKPNSNNNFYGGLLFLLKNI